MNKAIEKAIHDVCAQIENDIHVTQQQLQTTPVLLLIDSGENADTGEASYIKSLERAAKFWNFELIRGSEHGITPTNYSRTMHSVINSKHVTGVLFVAPQSEPIDIPHELDIDACGINAKVNSALGLAAFFPATPVAVIKFIDAYYSVLEPDKKDHLQGKTITIIGRGPTVGKPLLNLALSCDMTPTVLHSKSNLDLNIPQFTDIIVSCVGKPNLITFDQVANSCSRYYDDTLCVSVGCSADENGKLCSDFGFEDYLGVCAVTPPYNCIGKITTLILVSRLYTYTMLFGK